MNQTTPDKEGSKVPKVKMSSGKIKKFPYTAKGVKAAKAAAKTAGVEIEKVDPSKEYEVMNKKKTPNTYGLKYLKGK